ncbi:Uncharacterised protein [Klebsiella aerogenes]|uniref:hypothetical protein n=1 Tax=Klebsiella aerogenes TaxID=548 RepID=UPI00125105A7|nr:hypothetical protein [Klebsiella aerogenes]VAC93612.1 Uncharacterised protein [Klebsiella aerogenes]
MTNNQLTDKRLAQLAKRNFCQTRGEEYTPFGDEVVSMAAELQECRKVNADLTMWVKRLGYSLKRAKPDSKLPGNAMAYLNAKGLISVEDILR